MSPRTGRRRSSARLQVVIWAATFLAAAIAVQAPDNALCLLLALLAGAVPARLAVYELSPRADRAGERP